MWKNTLIGPIYFDGSLTSESYTEILSGPLADFLEDEVSLRDLTRMRYQRDGSPIGYRGQEVAEAKGGVSDTGLVLPFCGRQSF
ncbi:uncharacterized protein TNCV_3722221 [Trichonephila clavipes]|nr:uncharacterized protein TNCV_3722221 [Trichonephila clavipes]